MKLPPAARISRKVFPPSVLTSSTPPSKPRFGSTSDASRLKFCRKVNCAEVAVGIGNASESSRLSLTTAGSSMKAALGDESAGGFGTPESDVTHIGGGPSAFVASQPGGNAGGVTLSKFSLNDTGSEHGGEHDGAGAGGSATRAKVSSRPQLADPPARSAIAREELIAPATTTPAATNKSKQRIGRNREGVDTRLRLMITDRLNVDCSMPERLFTWECTCLSILCEMPQGS